MTSKARTAKTPGPYQKTGSPKTPGAGKKNVSNSSTFFERTEIFLTKYMNRILLASLLLTLTFSILLFDIRFSLAGDDSAYVLRAVDFLDHFIYPGFSGPLYPIVLSPFIAIFGIQAIPLKCLSLLFILGFVYFIYKAFRGRISAILLAALLILIPFNSFILYYASQTYSEAFFMFLQAIVLYVFFTLFTGPDQEKSFGIMIKQHLLLAVCILALGITRTIGLSAIIAVSAYFIIKGQWKNLVFFIISFTILFASFQGFKILVWENSEMHFAGQFENLVSKNYYDTGAGKEDMQGYITRVIGNSNYYLSDAFYALLGFREMKDSNTSYPLLAILTWLLIISSTIMSFKKNKYLFFTGVYTVIFIFITFLITQTVWKQSRLIIPYVPLILLMLLSLFYDLLSINRWKRVQWLFPVFVLILFGLSFNSIALEIRKTRQIDSKYYGLTPDWENYCKVSEWASENLPKNVFVACRKPSISFIYSNGKRFFGINRINDSPSDSLLKAETVKTLHYYFILPSSIDNNPVSTNLYYIFKKGMLGYGLINENNVLSIPFYLMRFPDSLEEKTLAEMKSSKVSYTADINILKTWLNNPKVKISIIYPDSLLNFLRKANVTHVITANLRADAAEKNGYTNNTVERFMNYIGYKYPDIMTKIIQMGSDDNEPAALYQINYDQTGSQVQ
jgi:hypothetical protein